MQNINNNKCHVNYTQYVYINTSSIRINFSYGGLISDNVIVVN